LTLMLALRGGEADVTHGTIYASSIDAERGRVRVSYAVKSAMAAAPCGRDGVGDSGISNETNVAKQRHSLDLNKQMIWEPRWRRRQ
jgi:hypothetical protein